MRAILQKEFKKEIDLYLYLFFKNRLFTTIIILYFIQIIYLGMFEKFISDERVEG